VSADSAGRLHTGERERPGEGAGDPQSFRERDLSAQRRWREAGLFEIRDPMASERRFYCLNMFPYPSGDLHVGHGRNYILGDVVTRLKRMQGFDVLSPMGWDAFGLPAENAAIANRIHPAVWTRKNIARMKEQLIAWGAMYDWKREIASCEPSYYRWTQWLFLQLYHRGLAYRAAGAVNWCPSCRTVLANEQVIEGRCERCDTPVETRDLEQWYFKITEYAEPLLNDLKLLEHWPEKVRTMQANWIGRSEGAAIRFAVAELPQPIEVFSTRPDTLFGATFLVLAVEHPAVTWLAERGRLPREAARFVERIRHARIEDRFGVDLEKEGHLTGLSAIHPLTGEAIPIWVANYVLMGYGTGAIMGVPAHDQRDYEFARKYALPIVEVYRPAEGPGYDGAAAFEGEGRMVNSGEFDGLATEAGRRAVIAALEKRGAGQARVNYRLRDWLISRQRYWGAPIPMVYCERCGVQPVPESELPVLLPEKVEFKPTGESPLLTHESFLRATCPACGGPARRETDTMDTFVDSSWYFLRYLSPTLETEPFSTTTVNRWLPVNQYIGGVEHAILHLLYSRFIVKVLRDMGKLSFSEPFERLFTQGMITKDGHKMSKSKGNVVPPDALIDRYGADTVRLYTLFIGPPEKDAEWNDRGVEGAYRFLQRYWNLIGEVAQTKPGPLADPPLGAPPRAPAGALADRDSGWAEAGPRRDLRRRIHELTRQILLDMERFHFNTAVSGAMQMVNALHDYAETPDADLACGEAVEAADLLTRLLAPMAPHTAEAAWARLGNTSSVFQASWPAADLQAIRSEVVSLVVQVNGKVRSKIQIPASAARAEIEAAALAAPQVGKFLEGKQVLKVVHVPGRLVNVVVG
jgi:leucyl-tRNA synthetase